MRVALKYAFLFSSFALLMGAGIGLKKYYKLSQNGIMVKAEITDKTCESHNEVKYTFTVGRQSFTGIDHADDCKTKRVADKIDIYYLESDPTVSSTSDPQEGLLDCIVGILIVSSLFPIFLMLIIRRKSKT